MHIFKLTREAVGATDLTREAFEQGTQLRPPWYPVSDQVGDQAGRQYALCPACDNPVQIIGMYKSLEHTDRPYGRHTGNPIEGFSFFDGEAYEWCPYVRRRATYVQDARKNALSGTAIKILQQVRMYYDGVVSVIGQAMGVGISGRLAQEMLIGYLAVEGHRYVGATLQNIPWMVVYLSGSHTLFGRHIVDRQLREALDAGHPRIAFDDDHRLYSTGGFVDVQAAFMSHRWVGLDEVPTETLAMSVTSQGQQNTANFEGLFRKTVMIDPDAWASTVSQCNERPERASVYLEIARRQIVQPEASRENPDNHTTRGERDE